MKNSEIEVAKLLDCANFPSPVPAIYPHVVQDGSETFDVANPSDVDKIVARYSWSSVGGIKDALDRSKIAFSEWSGLSCVQRALAIGKWLDAILAHKEAIAYAVTLEQGKPLAEARGEIGKSLAEARQMLGFSQSALGYTMPGRNAEFHNTVVRRPRGVCLAITPWNFPVLTPMRKIVPALAAGNSVILKPSEFTPAAALILTALGRDFFPDGLLTFVNGGADIATSLVSDPSISAVSFTGSVATGKKIAISAGGRLCPVSLELGGKNGVILDDVSDLDRALDAIVGAVFQCSGQRCTSISRVIVKRGILPKVIAGLKTRMSALRQGNGLTEGVNFGPITTDAQMQTISDIVHRATQTGAEVILGGGIDPRGDLVKGRFFEPTLLLSENSSNPSIVEEIFGPVLTLQPWDDERQAMELLNASEYGLTSAIFTDQLSFAQRFTDNAQSGMLHINHGTIPDDNMPFVGVKNSGLGIGSVGRSTLDFYSTEHSVYVCS